MFVTDILFPRFCVGCNMLGTYLCPQCVMLLKPVVRDVCIYCKKGSAYGVTHFSCRKKNGLDGCMSIYYYNPLMKKIIKEIKYRLATNVAHDFWNALHPSHMYKLQFFTKIISVTSIEPIPLHMSRMKERGFNQAELFSNCIRRYISIPISSYLKRVKRTSPQAQIQNELLRKVNIEDAFTVNVSHLGSKIILLFDDVVTTGETLKEAALVLKKAGALHVYSLTLARG